MGASSDQLERQIAEVRGSMESKIIELRERSRTQVRRLSRTLVIAVGVGAAVGVAVVGVLIVYRVTRPPTARERLQRIRKQGYCFALDDVALGLSALAVPIFDPQGEVLCGISMGGLTPQMSDRGRPLHLQRLRVAAEAIKTRL